MFQADPINATLSEAGNGHLVMEPLELAILAKVFLCYKSIKN